MFQGWPVARVGQEIKLSRVYKKYDLLAEG